MSMSHAFAAIHAAQALIPPKPKSETRAMTAELAASMAVDDAGMMLAHVRSGDRCASDHAMRHAQQVIEHIAAMLACFDIDLLEVLPTRTCSRCTKESVDCRSYGDELLCLTCVEIKVARDVLVDRDIELDDPDAIPFGERETLRQLPKEPEPMPSAYEAVRVAATMTISDMQLKHNELAERHRMAIGLLTDVERSLDAARTFLTSEVSK